MNKTIKKIVALSLGTTMLAGTAFSALATDLSDYPAPFVKDGVFVGKIVIGEKAASIDTVGALDIAASLQRAASVSAGTSSGSTQTSSSADGYLFKENEQLILGGNLSSVGISTIDDSEMPELLTSGTVEADDGTEYDYDVELRLSTSSATAAADVDSDMQDLGYVEPVVYFDLETGADVLYQTVIDFQDLWDASDFQDSETIELFGMDYTFDPTNGNTEDILTLFGSENTILVAKGGSETVTYMGKEYKIEVLGGNSDDSTAIVRINGDTRTLEEGDSKTMAGLPVYVKNVFVSNIGGDDVSVDLFVGSNKIEIDEDGTVTKNGVDLDEVTATFSKNSANWTDIDTITFTVKPALADDEITQILPGDVYVDPVFGAFKFQFVGSEDLEAGKEAIDFTRSGNLLSVEFTPREASEAISVDFLDDNAAADDIWTAATLTELDEDSIFFWNDGTAADNYATHVLQIDKITKGAAPSDEDFEVVIKDLSHGKSYTVDDTTNPVSSDIGLYVKAGYTNDTINLSSSSGSAAGATAVYTLYTNAGAKVTIDSTNASLSSAPLSGQLSKVYFNIDEDVDDDDETSTPIDFNVTQSWDSTDSEYDFGFTEGSLAELGDDDDVSFYLTPFGSYIVEDDDENSYVHVYVPSVEVSYDAWLLPVNSDVTVSGGSSSGGAVALNPIAVGLAIMDSEAKLGSKPYIVVGGPCANTVAAELLGNKAVCYEGFTEGKAVIKLFSSSNALLVAGYSGKDTQGASRVLANYDDYSFDGTELEVVTTSLSSLSVKKVMS